MLTATRCQRHESVMSVNEGELFVSYYNNCLLENKNKEI